ncbi:MAG: heparinase II/III family protein [Anaerolineae bacterium]|nr:heparinase II/III family protein [Anaerolineae bacterium]
MKPTRRFSITLKALQHLGLRPLLLLAKYRLQLHSGFFRWRLPAGGDHLAVPVQPVLALPSQKQLLTVLGDQVQALLVQADEVVAGQVRLFGSQPRPLQLTLPNPLQHWTASESAWVHGEDIKFTWEPGRFGWAITLARAYYLSGDETYAQSFWDHTIQFLEANPPNLGPQWSSAQEVALRLMALLFAYQLCEPSPHTTPQRKTALARSLAAHAARIPPTLGYARAQNNNHLLTEAAGLYTAGVALSAHPHAGYWRALGWRWLNHALQNQISADGVYIQHSANYHRLMLQAALWSAAVAQNNGDSMPQLSLDRLAAATRWLLGLLDDAHGQVPNLGPNDGAYILPLTVFPFTDYRPVLQAASLAFLKSRPFPNGPADEMALWLGQALDTERPIFPPSHPQRLHGKESWAYLRTAHFSSRPGHADQLHLDLWWRGLNLAQDAGTFLYNAPPPWENSLAVAAVHNTLTVNHQDHMLRAGRFLWLDWAQAHITEQDHGPDGRLVRLAAQHNGYRRLGLTHHRQVSCTPDQHWIITDNLLPNRPINDHFTARLHWLLPDWHWELEGTTLRMQSPHGWVKLHIAAAPGVAHQVQLACAGERLHGSAPVAPTQGWVSPTYGVKLPALSFAVTMHAPLPLQFTSTWTLPQ